MHKAQNNALFCIIQITIPVGRSTVKIFDIDALIPYDDATRVEF